MTLAAPQPQFSDEALKQLSAALRAYLALSDNTRRTELREALERLCAEAHAINMGPERMLVAVKSAWAQVPGIERMDIDRTKAAFSRVVEHCIEAYYGRGADPSASD